MSNLNEYKTCVMELCKFKGWDTCNVETVWLLLIEEIGELAGSIRRHNNYFRDKKRTKIEDELGDVFSYLFQIAGILNIDLNRMWETNQRKSINKKYFKDNQYRYNNERRSSTYFRHGPNRAENRQMV
jgi:NTP pyrophosphatase (non-canonical NTP hydrolase)